MPTPFRVLSIDGGGIRGYYSASYLAGLTQLYARTRGVSRLDFGSAFNLIVGSSTGAILGCAAAIGIPMEKVAQLYEDYGPRIFPVRLFGDWRILPQFFTRPCHLRSGEQALKEALTSVFGEYTISSAYAERGIALSVPSVNMHNQRAWVFKTPHLGGHRDDSFKLVDVCLASSAAPLYRSLAAVPAATDDLGGYYVFADGGLWANNPVLVALIDALEMAPPDQDIEIYSLGTCPRPEGETVALDDVHRGLWRWKFGGNALLLSLSAQEYAFDNMARKLSGILTTATRRVTVIRFPNGAAPPDTLKFLDIDDARQSALTRLKAQARADVSVTKSACDDANDAIGQKINTLLHATPVAK